jgi:two-component system, chemotaxis family, chemotaxis protein CheY
MTKQILIVDDSSIIRSHCRIVLKKAGYDCVEAWDAHQARARLESTDISFMLCDLNLPGMSGLELVEKMRSDPRLAALPAAIMTAECSLELVQRATRAGVKHWLLKPYTAEELVEMVTRYAGPP